MSGRLPVEPHIREQVFAVVAIQQRRQCPAGAPAVPPAPQEAERVYPNAGEVTVVNSHGKFKLKLPVGAATKPGEVFVQPVDEVSDGLLFEPAIIDQHKAVRINTDHPYYRKVYVPNLNTSVTVQGMDSLLWELCVAELSATTDKTAESFSDMRFEVSRILRKLVESLPEPITDSDVDVA